MPSTLTLLPDFDPTSHRMPSDVGLNALDNPRTNSDRVQAEATAELEAHVEPALDSPYVVKAEWFILKKRSPDAPNLSQSH